jgi:ribosomal protein S12 methylthiotransferase
MAIQKKISREKLRTWKGRTATALVEGPSKDNPLVWEARLEGMAPDIDGKLYLTDIELPTGETAETGDVARVEIIKADTYDLIGRVVDILPRADGRRNTDAASVPVRGIPSPEKLTRISTGAPLRVLG